MLIVTALCVKVWFFVDKRDGESDRINNNYNIGGGSNGDKELMSSRRSLPLAQGIPTQEMIYTTTPANVTTTVVNGPMSPSTITTM